jgi:hypothetical protein
VYSHGDALTVLLSQPWVGHLEPLLRHQFHPAEPDAKVSLSALEIRGFLDYGLARTSSRKLDRFDLEVWSESGVNLRRLRADFIDDSDFSQDLPAVVKPSYQMASLNPGNFTILS